METEFEVVIVGGGIAGSALASVLAEKGLDVALLEKRKRIEPAKHGVSLQPIGLGALSEMGILENILKIGEKAHTNTIYDEKHNQLVTLDLREIDHPYPYFLSLRPDELTKLFREHFVNSKGRVIEGFEVESLLRENEDVVNGVRGMLRNEETVELHSKVVVGAEGPFSKVRSLAGFETKVKNYNDHYLATVLSGSMPDSELRTFVGRGIGLGILPLKNNFTYIFWYVEKGEYEKIKKSDLQLLKKNLVNLEPELKQVLEGLQDWSQTTFIAPIAVFLNHWATPGVALIGDSAHATNPSLGQGMNQSLLDVVALGDVLEECHEESDFSYEKLQRYEELRYKQALFIQKQSELTALIQATNSRFQAWVGKRVLKKIAKDRGKRLVAMKLGAGLLNSLSLTDRLSLLI